ncbi:MAG: hypothetical protein WBM90_12675 [Acidimicrobiia bacterium]
MILVGVLLLSGLALMAVEAVGYVRGGYNSAFWKLPLDEKLDHVAENRWEWWWVSVWGLVGLFFMTGGVFGVGYLLANAGEPVLAYVAMGWYTVAALAWIYGLIVQAASVSEAAQQRAHTGTTPSWLHPFWNGAFVAELVWITGANLAYGLIGVAILQTGLVADWAGWVALGGVLIAVVVLIAREGFPQLGYLLPAAIGIALLIEYL